MSTTAVSRPASMPKAVVVLLFTLVLVGTGMLGSTKASAVVAPAFTGIVPADHWQGVQMAAARTVTQRPPLTREKPQPLVTRDRQAAPK
jgi:hypothetical protein